MLPTTLLTAFEASCAVIWPPAADLLGYGCVVDLRLCGTCSLCCESPHPRRSQCPAGLLLKSCSGNAQGVEAGSKERLQGCCCEVRRPGRGCCISNSEVRTLTYALCAVSGTLLGSCGVRISAVVLVVAQAREIEV